MTIQDNLHDQSNPSNQQQKMDQTPGSSGRQNIGGRQEQETVAQVIEAGGPILEVGVPVHEAVAQIQEDTTSRQPHEKGKGGKHSPRVEPSHGLRDLAASAVGLLDVRLSDINF
jgi:hypothetical protein